MSEDKIVISVNKRPSFTEIWYEGQVEYEKNTYKFWLIHPQNPDDKGEHYEIEIRWFFQGVPREIRALYPTIIESFKQKL